MSLHARDEEQLLGATAQGRANFTYNIRDFTILGNRYPHHGGIILAYLVSMDSNEKIHALDRILRQTEAEAWIGQIRWLNDWKSQASWLWALKRMKISLM